MTEHQQDQPALEETEIHTTPVSPTNPISESFLFVSA